MFQENLTLLYEHILLFALQTEKEIRTPKEGK
jgi:hypothetical protein